MGVRRRAWGAVRLFGGALILAAVVWWVGPAAFLDGLRGIGPGTLLAALAIGALTTFLCAWRWRVVAAALGVGLPLADATAAYYRSQFLNSALPGGVLGDVHRGLRHGIDAGDLGRGLRAVFWERVAGQVVQAGVDGAPEQLLPLALVVLLAAGIPLNVGGWGPREGAAAWIFSATQWGAGAGAAVATAFGVLTLVAVLPGAVVLLAGRQRPRAVPPAAPRPEPLAGVVPGGTR